jgi:hypothetical protein
MERIFYSQREVSSYEDLERLVIQMASDGFNTYPAKQPSMIVSFPHFKNICLLDNQGASDRRFPGFNIYLLDQRGQDSNYILDRITDRMFRESQDREFNANIGIHIPSGNPVEIAFCRDLLNHFEAGDHFNPRLFIETIAALYYYPAPVDDAVITQLMNLYMLQEAAIMGDPRPRARPRALSRMKANAKRMRELAAEPVAVAPVEVAPVEVAPIAAPIEYAECPLCFIYLDNGTLDTKCYNCNTWYHNACALDISHLPDNRCYNCRVPFLPNLTPPPVGNYITRPGPVLRDVVLGGKYRRRRRYRKTRRVKRSRRNRRSKRRI